MRKAQALPKPRPCIITALEFIGLDDPSMPAGRARTALSRVLEYLGDDPELQKHYDSHLSLTAQHALHFAPIKHLGMLPFYSVLKLVHLQPVLAHLGVLVRGAITMGEAAEHGSVLLGRGITDAERLRDELADVPRVIMDPLLLREIERNPALRAPHHDPMDELGYVRNLLRQDADGIWFVDYLWAHRGEVDEPPNYMSFFKSHRQLVLRKLEASPILNCNSRAATWLWRYHDQVFEELKKHWRVDADELAELRVPATSPLVYRFPPSAKAP